MATKEKAAAERLMTKSQWEAMERAKYHAAQNVIQCINAGLLLEAAEAQERFMAMPPSYVPGTTIPNYMHV